MAGLLVIEGFLEGEKIGGHKETLIAAVLSLRFDQVPDSLIPALGANDLKPFTIQNGDVNPCPKVT